MHTTELKVSIVCFEKAARSKSKTELTCNSEASECDKEMADSTVFLCRKNSEISAAHVEKLPENGSQTRIANFV